MGWEGWFTLATILISFGVMTTDRIGPDKVMVGTLAVLILAKIVSPADGLKGFANEGMMTVALLFVVAAAMRRTGALGALSQRVLGRPKTVAGAQLRLMAPVAAMSAFVNNTPLVAMLLPEVRDWARNRGVAPSRLLILLSYAAILGGVCTLIGTSTNLVVDGLIQEAGLPGLGFFEVSKLGIPFAAVGILFCVLLGRLLLPDRPVGDMPLADPRGFTAMFSIDRDGPLVGKRIGEVVIPDLQAFAPIELVRDGEPMPVPRREKVLEADDLLVFSAAMGELTALQQAPGLSLVTDKMFATESNRVRRLVELVVSTACPLVGQVVGQGKFRLHYDAAIVGIARHGERIVPRREGGWLLEAGDVLLVDGSEDFLALHRTNPDFYLVTGHGRIEPVRPWHRPVSLATFIAMIVLAASGVISMFEAALVASLVMLGSRIITWQQAQEDVNWSVLMMIATSFGLSAALEQSGAAAAIAHSISSVGGGSPWAMLALIYIGTVVTTEIVSNNAAAAMMLPVALSTAAEVDASYMPFVMAVMIGASAGFASPIGYQTHLMVYGPGGYRFLDFFRIGVPLDIVLAAFVIALTPVIWPF